MPTFNKRTIILISIIFLTGIFWAHSVLAQNYFCQPDGYAYAVVFLDEENYYDDWIGFQCSNIPPIKCCSAYPDDPNCCAACDHTCPPAPDLCNNPDYPEWQSYGVNIDQNGDFSGFAYDPFYDTYIDFGPTVFPLDLNLNPFYSHGAHLDLTTGEVTGYAQMYFLKDTPPDYGFISLSCQNDGSCNDPLPDDPDYLIGDYLHVNFNECRFTGYAHGPRLGWVSFDCSNFVPGCNDPNYPYNYFNKVTCGEPVEPFELLNLSRSDDFPSSAIWLGWERVGDISSYKIYKTVDGGSETLFKTLTVIDSGETCGEGDCIICSSDRCDYIDREAEPESAYSYRVEACSPCGCISQSNSLPPAITTISPPVSLTFCPVTPLDPCPSGCPSLGLLTAEQLNACKEQICSQGEIKLEWEQARGKDGLDGADGGYIFYRAIGGEGYQKNPGKSWFAQYGDEGGEEPESYYSGGIYSWLIPLDMGKHYYFFVRAVDGLDFGIDQDVDSNRVEICCLSQ